MMMSPNYPRRGFRPDMSAAEAQDAADFNDRMRQLEDAAFERACRDSSFRGTRPPSAWWAVLAVAAIFAAVLIFT